MPAASAATHPTDSGGPPSGLPLVGKVFTLGTAIVNGRGRMFVSGSTWLITGPELPAGSSVRVTGVEGPRLRVEHAGEV
jgi:membrane protein implicated in regulation of membrane protease activity